MAFHRIGLTAIALAAAAAASPGISAQDKSSQVLSSTREAIAAGKLDNLKSLAVEAQVQRVVSSFQINSDVEILVELPDKYWRSENSTGGPMNMSMTSGFDGDRSLAQQGGPATAGGMVIRMGGPMFNEKMTPKQQADARASAVRASRGEISRLMLGWFAMAHPSVAATYSYAGEAESPDGKADVVDAKGADGFSARLFIDRATHLPLMVTYQAAKRVVFNAQGGSPTSRQDIEKKLEELRTQPPPAVEYRLYFSDWAEMDGIRFPRKIQRASEGETLEEWTVTKVKLNPKIDPKKFAGQS